MITTITIIAVAIVGFVEWLKNLLPAKFKNSKFGLPILSGLLSAGVGTGFVFIAKPLFGLSIEPSVVNFLVYILGTVGMVQISYSVLLQTFKAVVSKLKNKYTTTEVNVEEVSDKIVGAIDSKVAETINKTVEEITKG